MTDVHKITSLDATWKPGDVVLDAEGNLLVRSAHPHWVWDYPSEAGLRDHFGNLSIPEGAVEEGYAVRPLILLVREGRAVAGREIAE